MIRLNGSQRLGVVLAAVWTIGVASIATYEYANRKDGWFAGLTLPVGTVVSGSKATLPDGRSVDLNMTLEGKSVKPWEVQWDNEAQVPTAQVIHWRALLGGLALPFFLWATVFLLARVVGWVRNGFR